MRVLLSQVCVVSADGGGNDELARLLWICQVLSLPQMEDNRMRIDGF